MTRLGLLVGLLLAGALVVAALPATVLAAAHPIACYGDVTLDGAPALAGTEVNIYLDGDLVATTEVAPVTPSHPHPYWVSTSRIDDSRYGDILTYTVDGYPATTHGPDLGVFGPDNQEVDLEAVSGPHNWRFSAAGFFPKHLPDSYNGEVVLADLDLADIPAQVQGVWWWDDAALEWKFWVPGVGGGLMTLGGGHTFDYVVLVAGACDWVIPIP